MDSATAVLQGPAPDRLARGLRNVFRVLRGGRLGDFAAWSDEDLAGNAQGLAYALRASRWQRRARLPDWPAVHAAWRARAAATEQDGAAPSGRFAADDTWTLVTDNAQAFALRDRLHAQATRSIDLATFYIEADATGWRTAHALAACARRGVRVRVVADRQATLGKAFRDPQVLEVIRFLRAAGVAFRLFQDPQRPFDACHRKLLLVDGRALLLGGRNLADHYAGPDWRDVELLLEGPSAALVQPLFDETLANAPGRAPLPAGGLFQPTTPQGIADNAAFVFLLQRIREARRTLDIENAYYFAHAPVHEALAAAVRRGVRVRVFTNSAQSNDLPFMNHRLLAGFPALVEAGIELYLRQGEGRTLHGKYFIADGEWVGFGSSNLDFYSPRFCLELGLHVRDRALADRLGGWFEAGIAQARRVADAQQLRAEPAPGRASAWFDRLCRDIQ